MTTNAPLPSLPALSTSPSKASSSAVITSSSIHQIYEGQKFFWRQRLNLDLNFIFHRSEHLLEVISYDSDNSLELNRLYLNSDAVYDVISTDLHSKVAEMKKELSKDRFKKVPPDSELINKVGDNLISQFILNRLIVATENGTNLVKLSLLSADTFDLNLILTEKISSSTSSSLAETNEISENTAPASTSVNSDVSGVVTSTTSSASSTAASSSLPIKENKQAVRINRRRKTASGEFDRALSSLRQNSVELNAACDRAAKLTELSSKSVNSFKDALKIHASKYNKSTPIERFKWAVHRVILNNSVDKIRLQLAKREKFQSPLRINATFPLPDGSIITPANAAAQLQRIPLLTKIHETYSNGPSPFQSPFASPRGKGTTAATSSKKPLVVDTAATATGGGMPAVNQRQKSAGKKTLMASQSLPTEVSTTSHLSTSPQNQAMLHLPSLKDGKSPSASGAALTAGAKETKKKTKK
jgi:hypothetical protein